MEFTCDCCGFTQDFVSAKEAFDEGWDVPPYFTGYVACSLCPGSFIAMGQTKRHNSIHERWEREGRPGSGRGLSGGGAGMFDAFTSRIGKASGLSSQSPSPGDERTQTTQDGDRKTVFGFLGLVTLVG